MPWRWAAAAAATTRKLTGISQSRVSVAFTGRLLYRSFGSDSSESRKRSLPRGVVSIGAISLAGGLVLSAVNDLAIFNGCTTKAIEHAADNPAVVEAIGVPIVRGPWYDASLEVGHRRRSVSCTFPVSGPHGSGFLQIKATRDGEDGLLSFLRHHDWKILLLEAHLEAPSDDEDQRKLVKVNLASSGRGEDGDPESG
ncbi:hypothetical protein Zm00014a_014871 [Zea mays]|uniref:Mitochondrial import inner membrane translocase subunit Tim21 n=1 Tax=Zea mays TaxID=4577 RepID=A0A3L6DW16_MAIZE|nr:hypothetical protein Zm00014a_014871 [Zea mays]